VEGERGGGKDGRGGGWPAAADQPVPGRRAVKKHQQEKKEEKRLGRVGERLLWPKCFILSPASVESAGVLDILCASAVLDHRVIVLTCGARLEFK